MSSGPSSWFKAPLLALAILILVVNLASIALALPASSTPGLTTHFEGCAKTWNLSVGDGIRCIDGSLKVRLYAVVPSPKNPSVGVAEFHVHSGGIWVGNFTGTPGQTVWFSGGHGGGHVHIYATTLNPASATVKVRR